MVRDIQSLVADHPPGSLCLVSNDPQFKEALAWASQRGWFVMAITGAAALKSAAGTALPLKALEEAGFRSDPFAVGPEAEGLNQRLQLNRRGPMAGLWGSGDPNAEREIFRDPGVAPRPPDGPTDAHRAMADWYS